MTTHRFLAIDLGAQSGRIILGELEGKKLRFEEIKRFHNAVLTSRGRCHWDVEGLFNEIINGLKVFTSCGMRNVESVGVDTWGVDFGFLDAGGSLVGAPYSYRDPRTNWMMEELFKTIPAERVYRLTGIQLNKINTLFQLFAMAREEPETIAKAKQLLFMPDLFNYLLTGAKRTEFTIATTSQLYNPTSGAWEDELLHVVGLRKSMMQNVVPPGTVIGKLRQEVARETGLGRLRVIAPATHDTASAVAAVPAEGANWAYISSGTWSLMGVEIRRPIFSKQAMELNFTNEGGVDGMFRFLRNINGLWLIRRCMEEWENEQTYDYDKVIRMAREAPPFVSLIKPDAEEFLNPASMTKAIRMFCLRTDQPAPASPSEFARCVLESLALCYRSVLDEIRLIHPRPVKIIHVVGGGSQNSLLCQFTANATGLPVAAGPAEATAAGNVLLQAMALGDANSLSDVREIVRHSFRTIRYEPHERKIWETTYGRFRKLVQ